MERSIIARVPVVHSSGIPTTDDDDENDVHQSLIVNSEEGRPRCTSFFIPRRSPTGPSRGGFRSNRSSPKQRIGGDHEMDDNDRFHQDHHFPIDEDHPTNGRITPWKCLFPILETGSSTSGDESMDQVYSFESAEKRLQDLAGKLQLNELAETARPRPLKGILKRKQQQQNSFRSARSHFSGDSDLESLASSFLDDDGSIARYSSLQLMAEVDEASYLSDGMSETIATKSARPGKVQSASSNPRKPHILAQPAALELRPSSLTIEKANEENTDEGHVPKFNHDNLQDQEREPEFVSTLPPGQTRLDNNNNTSRIDKGQCLLWEPQGLNASTCPLPIIAEKEATGKENQTNEEEDDRTPVKEGAAVVGPTKKTRFGLFPKRALSRGSQPLRERRAPTPAPPLLEESSTNDDNSSTASTEQVLTRTKKKKHVVIDFQHASVEVEGFLEESPRDNDDNDSASQATTPTTVTVESRQSFKIMQKKPPASSPPPTTQEEEEEPMKPALGTLESTLRKSPTRQMSRRSPSDGSASFTSTMASKMSLPMNLPTCGAINDGQLDTSLMSRHFAPRTDSDASNSLASTTMVLPLDLPVCGGMNERQISNVLPAFDYFNDDYSVSSMYGTWDEDASAFL